MNFKVLLSVIISLIISAIIFSSCQSNSENKVRVREKFNSGWRFINEDVANAQDPKTDDSSWRQLDLPHDWAIEGPFSKQVYFQGGFALSQNRSISREDFCHILVLVGIAKHLTCRQKIKMSFSNSTVL
jgi:hypothetical protein